MIALIIATVIYYKDSNEITNPQLGQLNNLQDNQDSQNEAEQPQSEQLQPVINDTITYTLQKDKLNITYDKGNDWIEVPVEKDQLFDGEYNGNKQKLIEDSYILTENRAAFIYSDGVNWDEKRILLIYSVDQGKTWEKSLITKPFPAMRFRKVDFLNDNFGYIIISGGRTMSQESSHVFLTRDGGESWEQTDNSGVTRLISGGGFIDETTGFLSFGTINPDEPDLYVTQDAGDTWSKATINIPEKYHQILVSAETPVKERDHLIVLVNQGPNGDFKGGQVKGRFISMDNGKTWEFQKEVQPNEAE
nr:sialidase family protein [Virgibacillus litoralis]